MMNTDRTPTTFNLNTSKGRAAAVKALTEEADSGATGRGEVTIGDLTTYITTGIPELVYKDVVIVEHNNGQRHAVKGGVIYSMGVYWEENSLLNWIGDAKVLAKKIKNCTGDYAEGVILPTPLATNKEEAVLTILQNGDEDGNGLVGSIDEYNFPTVSFRCLGRFYNDEKEEKGVDEALKAILSGQLQVIDFRPDERIDMTKEDVAAVRAYNKYIDAIRNYTKPQKVVDPPTPPERGFAPISEHHWHRSATVLMYDKSRRMTIILGVDEDAYFGCELPGSPKTVADAFTALIPKDLRDRGTLSRQGEWFFVPVPEAEVPSVVDAVLHVERFSLPVEHVDSNQHQVECEDGRVAKNGTVYAFNPMMEHDDHATVDMKGWYTFRRNTAKRSYSEAGVD